MSRKRNPRKYGIYPIGARRKFGQRFFILTERLPDYPSAHLAAAEYRAEKRYARVVPVEQDGEGFYEVWTRSHRRMKVKKLSFEYVERTPGKIIQGSRLVQMSARERLRIGA